MQEGKTPDTNSTGTPRVYTEEEVKKMLSDWERWVQKVLSEKKEAERIAWEVLKALSKVSEDWEEALVQLYESDPKVAEKVLSEYYGMTIEEYKEQIGYQEDLSNPEIFNAKVEKEAQKKLEQVTMQKEVDSFITKLKMWDEEKKVFLEAFEERKTLKSFNPSDIDKHLVKAYKEIANDEDIERFRKSEAVANWMAVNWWSSVADWKKQKNSKKEEASKQIDDFFKRMGLD